MVSEWVRISTRNPNDEYSKGMNGMNSTKVNDIKDKVNKHMQKYIPNIYIQTYKNVHRIGACRGMSRQYDIIPASIVMVKTRPLLVC